MLHYYLQQGVNQYYYTPVVTDVDGDNVMMNLSCVPANCPFYMDGLSKCQPYTKPVMCDM